MASPTAYAQTLIRIAGNEYNAFHEFLETDEPLRSRIDAYCDGIGIGRPVDIDGFPWSATFVSWCVKAAGATDEEFKSSSAHAVFVKAAIANADQKQGLFRARQIDEYAPKVGDIVQRNREGGTITYKQARTRSSYPSHSAIVVELGEGPSGKYAITVGGSEGNSLRRTRVALTPSGHIRQTESNPFICVIENLKADAAANDSRLAPNGAGHESLMESTNGCACEASGEPAAALLEAAIEKPPVDRVESSPNKSSRGGAEIDHIVIHYTTSRNIEGSISHFKNPASQVSAHYIVGQDGKLVQVVADKDRAWHAGNSAMNARSIGIEHVARTGDKITDAQARTSIALIKWLMQTYAIPVANIIPHVCVKDTSCCGDLFQDFGGGAGLPCAKQKPALHKWLAANGIGESGAHVERAPAAEPPRHWVELLPEIATSPTRLAMARVIVDFEARRDAQGRIAIYELDPRDGGGRYEVAGINERYHKEVCDELVALIRAGRHAEAETRAAEFIADYTDQAAQWTHNPGIEFFMRDCVFNRGPGGAAWILQKAVGVETDGAVGPVTLAAAQAAEANPRELVRRLRQARETYERRKRDESSIFWTGLVNRWNKAQAKALAFMSGAPEMVSGIAPATAAAAASTGAEAARGLAVASPLPAQAGPGLPLDVGATVRFIDTGPSERPFADIGADSPIDDPAQMLAGWRGLRNGVPAAPTLEVAIGRDMSLPAAFLEVLAKRRRAVGKISASGTNYLGDSGFWAGTGFLVAKNILLTNHHVLNSIEVARSATVDFSFEVPADDFMLGVREPSGPSQRRFRVDPSRLFITSPVSDGLDFTFVWIEDEAEATFGSIPMERAAFAVGKDEQAFVVHHPQGHGRRVSLDDTDVLTINTTVIRYSSDTMPGSSGSPVFNRQGRLIALHHASQPEDVQLPDGGHSSVLNEGIKIAAIVVDLERRLGSPEAQMARTVLEAVRGSDTMAGFFGQLGRVRPQQAGSGPEQVVDSYRGTDADVDVGFWNIEWLATRYHDAEKLRMAAALIVDLGLDVWGLEEVSPAAVRALVGELKTRFGERYDFALSEPDAADGKQSTAVIWKTKTMAGARVEWPADIEPLWHLRSTDDLSVLGPEAVEGKLFDRYPGLFRFSTRDRHAPFTFNLVPLHLKAMAEGSRRRQLASRAIAHAVKLMTERQEGHEDWVIGGDYNASLASNDFKALLDADFRAMSAEDEEAGAFSYIKSPKSLIDHIFLSPNLAARTGADDYFIVAKERSVQGYVGKLSDHRPVLVRLSLSARRTQPLETGDDLDRMIGKVLGNGAASRRVA